MSAPVRGMQIRKDDPGAGRREKNAFKWILHDWRHHGIGSLQLAKSDDNPDGVNAETTLFQAIHGSIKPCFVTCSLPPPVESPQVIPHCERCRNRGLDPCLLG